MLCLVIIHSIYPHVKGLETELRDYVNIILPVFHPRCGARYWREIRKHETTALLTGIFTLATDKYTSQECVCRVLKIRYMPWYRRKLMPFIQSSRICTFVFIYLYILWDYFRLESQNLNFTLHFHEHSIIAMCHDHIYIYKKSWRTCRLYIIWLGYISECTSLAITITIACDLDATICIEHGKEAV